MSKKNLTLTPFARLFLVLLFVGPLAYIGASYYNGEDGVQNIMDMIGIGQEGESKETRSDSDSDTTYSLEKENEELRGRIEKLKSENEALEKENEILQKQSEH